MVEEVNGTDHDDRVELNDSMNAFEHLLRVHVVGACNRE